MNTWKVRPADEQYDTREAAHAAALALAERSVEEQYKFVELSPGFLGDKDTGEVVLRYTENRQEKALGFNHWSFGQLASLVGAPAQWLAGRPAALVAAELTVDLKRRYADKAASLYYIPPTNGETGLLRAANGTRYARLTNAELLDEPLRILEDEGWVPAHKANAALVSGTEYAGPLGKLGKAITLSDRDAWAFYIAPHKPVDAGGGDLLYPMLTLSNSEVGGGMIDFESGLFRSICSNRSILGVTHTERWSARHVGRVVERFRQEFLPALATVAKAPAEGLETVIRKSREQEIASSIDDVLDFLAERDFGKAEAKAAVTYAEAEGLNPRSIYGVVQGLTAQAREIEHQDARYAKEARAGKLFDLVPRS